MKVFVTYEYDTPPCSIFENEQDADKHIELANAGQLSCQCCFVDEKEVSRNQPGAVGTNPAKE